MLEQKNIMEVHFGYDSSNHPTGGHEGMGCLGEKATGPINGDFIDFICLDSENYLITKITSAFPDSQHKVSKYDVRRALVDVFADGSAVLYLDGVQDYKCQQIETVLNMEKTKVMLEKGWTIREICEAGFSPDGFNATKGEVILATSIKHDVFEKKKNLIANCRKSISEMQQELEELKEKLYGQVR